VRHATGDRETLEPVDVAENEYSMVHGYRLLSGATPGRGILRSETRTRMPDTSAFAEMRKLLNRKVIEQHREGAICHEEFTDYNVVVVVPDHKITTVYASVENREHLSHTFTNR